LKNPKNGRPANWSAISIYEERVGFSGKKLLFLFNLVKDLSGLQWWVDPFRKTNSFVKQ